MKMPTRRRRYLTVAATTALALTLAACSSDAAPSTEASPSDSSAATQGEAWNIAFLMPDRGSTRYDQQDYPLFEQRIQELCPECTVSYQNAETDPQVQQQQADAMITNGVDLIVLDAVDTTAAANTVATIQAAGIPVITYDRPVPTQQADFYVSFDNVEIGKLISEDLVKHLDEIGADSSAGGVLIVNGSPTDDAAMLIKEGIHQGVDPSDYTLLAELDTPDWKPENAQNWVTQQITEYGDQILGVVAANDGTGGGTISALQAAGMVDPIPPVTGNDAEIAAIQRIIRGDQYNTISKPIKIVAFATAEVAIALLRGEAPEATTVLFDTPSQLYVPEVVTEANVKEVIFDGGIYTYDQVCTDEFADACAALDITS